MTKRPKPQPARAGQESVWDYPRPPRLERSPRRIRALAGGETLADSSRAWRVLETSHPPTYYLPPEDLRMDLLVESSERSFCEWKGQAVYFDALIDGRRFPKVAWAYPEPTAPFALIRDHLAFYLPAIEVGYVDDFRAEPQPGGFYGGWVTPDLVGPFKGEPGSWGW